MKPSLRNVLSLIHAYTPIPFINLVPCHDPPSFSSFHINRGSKGIFLVPSPFRPKQSRHFRTALSPLSAHAPAPTPGSTVFPSFHRYFPFNIYDASEGTFLMPSYAHMGLLLCALLRRGPH